MSITEDPREPISGYRQIDVILHQQEYLLGEGLLEDREWLWGNHSQISAIAKSCLRLSKTREEKEAKFKHCLERAKLWEKLESVAFEDAASDSDLDQCERESAYECLTEAINGRCYWHVKGSRMTWQNLSGYADIEVEDGEGLINKIKPNTQDFSWQAWKSESEEGVIEVTIWHHDSPTGEFYTLTPVDPPDKD